MSLWSEFLTSQERPIHKWVHYFPIYERHFSGFVNRAATFIEIGVSKGGSLQLWKRYLGPFAQNFEMTPQVSQFNGRTIVVHRQDYLHGLGWKGFCGGSAPNSYWMTAESILGVLDDLGFAVEIGNNARDHPNGPSMLIFAERQHEAKVVPTELGM
jgi:hypothetical protein